MSRVHYTLPPPKPKLSYYDELCIKHPVSDDPKEREEKKQANLAKMKAMAASVGLNTDDSFKPPAHGYSEIGDDPVIVKWRTGQEAVKFLELRRDFMEQQRRQKEEFQRKAQEAAAIRTKKIIFEHACALYDNRVKALERFGPKIAYETSKLLAALDNDDMPALERAIIALVNNVIEPSRAIYDAMNRNIRLEALGATTLNTAWPVATIDKVLDTFNAPVLSLSNDNFQATIGYFLQGLRDIFQPIVAAVPLVNPLGDTPAQPFVAADMPITFETFAAKAQRKGDAPNAGKNFDSFADLARATAQGQPLPGIVVTPPSS